MKIKNHCRTFLLLTGFICSFVFNSDLNAQGLDDTTIYDISIEKLMNIPLDKASIIGLPHPHPKGSWHFQHQYMDMGMAGTMSGSQQNNPEDVRKTYMMLPTQMHMHMQMSMIMYGLSKKITLMAMTHYSIYEMQMEMMGAKMSMESSGMGDSRFVVTYIAAHKNRTSVIANFGASFPTGSIDKSGTNMMSGATERLPYNMQLGSGTVDPLFDICFLGSTMRSSWGISLNNTFRLYHNKNGYNFGNQYKIMTGYGHKINDWLNITSRFDAIFWNGIDGRDAELNFMSSPNHRADLTGGRRFEISGGLAFTIPGGLFDGLELMIDYRQPFYQYLEGPQMPVTHHILGTIQWIFNKKTIR